MKSKIIAAFALMSAASAYAGLQGASMTAWRERPIPWLPGQYEVYNPKTFVVSDGVELAPFTNDILTTLDVADSSITINFPGERMVGFDIYSGSFAFRINTPNILIKSVSLGPNTGRLFDWQLAPLEFNPQNIRWTEDHIFIDLPTMLAKKGAKIELMVSTSAVPEPSTSLLMLIGVAGVFSRVRNSKNPYA